MKKHYDFSKGILGSPWNGLRNFKFYFYTANWSRTTFNTLWINFNNTLWETVIAVAFAIFLLVRQINRMKKAPEPAAPNTKEYPHCFTSIPIKATRCPNCTSEL